MKIGLFKMRCLFVINCLLNILIGGHMLADAIENTTKRVKGLEAITQVIGCENHKLSLTCSVGTAIKITSTDLGRHNRELCPHPDPATQENTNCSYDETDRHAKLCDNYQNCLIDVNVQSHDPCFGTYKYLTVNYTCVDIPSGVPIHLVGCHHTMLTLSCAANARIQVLSADYGRHSTELCPYVDPNAMQNTQCSLSISEQIANLCNGGQVCGINIDGLVDPNEDPCFGTYKYVSVSYICNEIPPEVECEINEEYGCDDPCRYCSQPRHCQKTCDKRCICKKGFKRDSATGKCIDEKYCPQSSIIEDRFEVFSECANCQPVCFQNSVKCNELSCVQGYSCAPNYVRDPVTGDCVYPDSCVPRIQVIPTLPTYD